MGLRKKTVHIIIMHFYQVRARMIVLTLKVVKHGHELIPVKNRDARNALGIFGISLDTTNS